jgi:hypothetical protein
MKPRELHRVPVALVIRAHVVRGLAKAVHALGRGQRARKPRACAEFSPFGALRVLQGSGAVQES